MFYVEGGGSLMIDNNKVFIRNIIVESGKINEIRKRFNNTDCYTTAYKYDSQDIATANLYGDFYLDLDYMLKSDTDLKIIQSDLRIALSTLHNLFNIPYEYIRVYFSGSKGFHIIVPSIVFNITPCNNLNLYFREVANYINEYTKYKTIDLKIYDRVRLLRLDNSINSKTSLYKIQLDLDFAKNCTYQELCNKARKPQLFINNNKPTIIKDAAKKYAEIIGNMQVKINRNKIRNSSFELPICIKNMLESEAPEGSRNNTSVTCASALLQHGKSFDETYQILLEWNDTYNNPKLSNKEIQSTVTSAQKELEFDKCYGCNAVKTLGFCVGTECPLYK